MSDCKCACNEQVNVPITGISVPLRGIGVNIDGESLKGVCGPGRDEIQEMIDGTVREKIDEAVRQMEARRYLLCEFYYFRHPDLRPGFLPARGDIIEDAAELYPEAWAYLQSPEGRKLCKTEAEWQAMSTAVWHTNADGTKVGWNGLGGVPFYVLDCVNGTLRLPDLRGMYAEAAGFDDLGVGGVHGDAIRNITGRVPDVQFFGTTGAATGALSRGAAVTSTNSTVGAPWNAVMPLALDTSYVHPTANKVQPRAWGAVACVYLGAPR